MVGVHTRESPARNDAEWSGTFVKPLRYQPVSFSIAPGMGYSSTSVVSNGKNCDKIRSQLLIDYARYARWIASDNAGHIQSLLMEVGREHLSRASTLLEEPLQIPCSSHPS